MPGHCATCAVGRITTVCSNCKITYYCHTACQKKDWKQHKLICATLQQKSSEKETISSSNTNINPSTEVIENKPDETDTDLSLHISYHKLSELSQTIQQLLSITFDNAFIPKSICNEIAEFASVYFTHHLEYFNQHEHEDLLFPSELFKYSFFNDFGFTIFVSIGGLAEDDEGFDGCLLYIPKILSIRFHDGGDNMLIVEILDEEQTFFVKGSVANADYVLCFTILKLSEYKYVVMVRDLEGKLHFDQDEESDEEDYEENDYEQGVLEFDVREHFNEVIEEDTTLQIGNTPSGNFFDGVIHFVSIKPDVHESL